MSFFTRILVQLRNAFMAGLFTIIPVALTVSVIVFVYRSCYSMLAPLRAVQPDFLTRIPGSEFCIATILILMLGVILRLLVVHSIIHYFERLIARIPLVRIVYSSAKMLMDFFKVSGDKVISRSVVLIQYPREGNFHLAFLLESAEDSYQKVLPERFKKNAHEKFVKVFMPNSPNPTTGYFFILPEDEIVYTDISFEEAVKTLVSCGLITPESLKELPTDWLARQQQRQE